MLEPLVGAGHLLSDAGQSTLIRHVRGEMVGNTYQYFFVKPFLNNEIKSLSFIVLSFL